jgi:hypothetical protein
MCCIVVKRGEFNRYDTLYKAFATQSPVIWDRRVGDRRRGWRAFDGPDRRAADRRGAAPPSWQALKFVVVDDPALSGAMASRMLAMR